MVGVARIELARCPVPKTGGQPLAHTPNTGCRGRDRTCNKSIIFNKLTSLLFIILVERVGFEPTKPFRAADLQSAGFSHSPISP